MSKKIGLGKSIDYKNSYTTDVFINDNIGVWDSEKSKKMWKELEDKIMEGRKTMVIYDDKRRWEDE